MKNKRLIPAEEKHSLISSSIDVILKLSFSCVLLRNELIQRGCTDEELNSLFVNYFPDNFEDDVESIVKCLAIFDFSILAECSKTPRYSAPDDYDTFIEKYLVPGKELSKEEQSKLLNTYTYKDAPNPPGIEEYIREMPYKDFLETPYWKAIAQEAKYGHETCQICGSNKNLEVHHPSYDIHGDEIHNVFGLTVLCHDCHAKFHNKK